MKKNGVNKRSNQNNNVTWQKKDKTASQLDLDLQA